MSLVNREILGIPLLNIFVHLPRQNNIMITTFILTLTHMSHLSCPVKPDRYVDVVTAVSILFTRSFVLLPPWKLNVFAKI